MPTKARRQNDCTGQRKWCVLRDRGMWGTSPQGLTCVGCYRRLDTLWIIRLDSEALRVHELAHCAGWPSDHPGGVWKWSSNGAPYPVFSRER